MKKIDNTIDYEIEGSIPAFSPFDGDDWEAVFKRPMVGGDTIKAGDFLLVGYNDCSPVLYQVMDEDVEGGHMTFDPDQVISVHRGCNKISRLR